MPSTNDVDRQRRRVAVVLFLIVMAGGWALRVAARRSDSHGLRRSDGRVERDIDCERCGDVAWTGTWFFPRGGAYLLFVDVMGRSRASLAIDGETVLRAEASGPPARSLVSRVYRGGAHAVRVEHEGDGGLRLFWIPPARRCDPEYVPAAALRPVAPCAAGAMPADLVDGEEAAVATAALLAVCGLSLGLWGGRLPRWQPARSDVWGAVAAFSVAMALRRWRLGAFGQTWDEDCYWSAGRNYVLNLLRFDFRPSSWAWNYEHPPIAKYLVGLAGLWHDGYGPARALEAALGAATCVVVFALGRELFSRRVGMGAALLYASLPHAVAHSQITGLETPSTFFATLAFWAFVRRRFLLAGLAGGLALASRFIAGLVFVAMAAAALVDPPRSRRAWLRLAASPLVGLGTLFAVWPRLWIDGPISGIRSSLGKLTTQHAPEWFLGSLVQAPVPKTYLLAYFAATVTVPVLVGLALCGLRRDRATAVCALFFASPFLVAFLARGAERGPLHPPRAPAGRAPGRVRHRCGGATPSVATRSRGRARGGRGELGGVLPVRGALWSRLLQRALRRPGGRVRAAAFPRRVVGRGHRSRRRAIERGGGAGRGRVCRLVSRPRRVAAARPAARE